MIVSASDEVAGQPVVNSGRVGNELRFGLAPEPTAVACGSTTRERTRGRGRCGFMLWQQCEERASPPHRMKTRGCRPAHARRKLRPLRPCIARGVTP